MVKESKITLSKRRGHNRTNKYGTTFWVREHDFSASNGNLQVDRGPDLWSSRQEYLHNVVQSEVKPVTCWFCGQTIFFYSNQFGSKVFFDRLGKPWPKHSCEFWDSRIESGEDEPRRWVRRNDGTNREEILDQQNHVTPEELNSVPLVDLSPLLGRNKIGVLSQDTKQTRKGKSRKSKRRSKPKPIEESRGSSVSPKVKSHQERTEKNRAKWIAEGRPLSGRQKTAPVEYKKPKKVVPSNIDEGKIND